MMVWFCVLASLVVIAGYALCWLYSGSGKIAFLGALGIWFFATIGFSHPAAIDGISASD